MGLPTMVLRWTVHGDTMVVTLVILALCVSATGEDRNLDLGPSQVSDGVDLGLVQVGESSLVGKKPCSTKKTIKQARKDIRTAKRFRKALKSKKKPISKSKRKALKMVKMMIAKAGAPKRKPKKKSKKKRAKKAEKKVAKAKQKAKKIARKVANLKQKAVKTKSKR